MSTAEEIKVKADEQIVNATEQKVLADQIEEGVVTPEEAAQIKTHLNNIKIEADAALTILGQAPPFPGEFIRVAPDGGPQTQASTFLDALEESAATGKPIRSDAGIWDLSEVTPFVWPENYQPSWSQAAGQGILWHFHYKNLGGMFSLSSGAGFDLDGVSAMGYDELFVASEDYTKVGYSGGRLTSANWFRDGAPPAMGLADLGPVAARNGNFEGPIFTAITGPWWKSGDLSIQYPGIESAIFEGISWTGFGGITINTLRHGNIVVRNCRSIMGETTKAKLYPFYEKFGIDPRPGGYWSKGALMTDTGQPDGKRLSAFAFGRNINLPDGSSIDYSRENGDVSVLSSTVALQVNDLTPLPNKYGQDLDIHAVVSVAARKVMVEDCYFANVMDFSYAENHEWAREGTVRGSMGTEAVYTKGDLYMLRTTAENIGPGEGPLLVSKPGGGYARDCKYIRNKVTVPEPYRTRLSEYPLMHRKNESANEVKLRPGEPPEPQVAALGLNRTDQDGATSLIQNLECIGEIELPPGGWEALVMRWGSHVSPAPGLTVKDLNNNQLYP